ncbi:MAG: hypothetical protein JNN04_12455 [Cyclobacteriaceae bacterium]|nr:hypothetical protein [Cyclobacteriaceae bacterium]
MQNSEINFGRVLKAGFIAAFIGVGLNNIWSLIAGVLGATIPPAFAIAVTISSLLPVVVASLVYFVLARYLAKGPLIFTVLGVGFLLFSFFPIFNNPQLPDGTVMDDTFPLLVAPMHVFSGVLALYGIPKWSR